MLLRRKPHACLGDTPPLDYRAQSLFSVDWKVGRVGGGAVTPMPPNTAVCPFFCTPTVSSPSSALALPVSLSVFLLTSTLWLFLSWSPCEQLCLHTGSAPYGRRPPTSPGHQTKKRKLPEGIKGIGGPDICAQHVQGVVFVAILKETRRGAGVTYGARTLKTTG